MKRKLLSVLIANLFAASAAVAAEGDFQLSGSIGLGVRGISETSGDRYKLNEYRDLNQDGVISEIDVKGRGGKYHLDMFGENLGLDDQYIDLKGGQYGVFKYRLYDNKLRHNLTFGAITPYTGVGSDTLRGVVPFPNTNLATFTRFDYGYKREDIGGMFEFSNNSPWYVRTEVNEVTNKGVRPVGYAQGSSPGQGGVELPTPVDYKTTNFTLEGGYSSRKGHASLSWTQSKFSEGVNQLNWQNGYFGNAMDAALLPPSNDMTKIAANGVLKQLPMSSTLAARYTYSKVTNSFTVQTAALNGTGGGITTAAATPATFNGNVKYETVSLSLSSSPTRALDTKAYFNWNKKDNNSTPIAYAAGVFAGPGAQAQVIAARAADEHNNSYRKTNFGLDLGYRISKQNKLSGGYDWLETKRDRADYDKSKDQKVFAQLKNSALANLDVRLKYQYLQRRSDFKEPFVAPTDPSNGYFLYAVRRYDVSSFDQNLFKLILDWNPAPLLDLGFETIYKDNKYKDVILGRTKDDRQEFFVNVSYGDPKKFRMSAFGTLEYVQYDATHRYVGQATCTAAVSCDPAAPAVSPPPTTAYTWNTKNKDKSYALGVGADWPVLAKLMLKGSYLYSVTEGAVDFTTLAAAAAANYPRNIVNFDNTKSHALNLRGVYSLDKQWELTGGFAYERYRYTDDATTGYSNRYVDGTTTTAAYLSGAYANPDYTARILYLTGKYKF